MDGRDYWSAGIGRLPETPVSAEALRRAADILVTRPGVPRSFVPAGYGVKPGERVLLGVNSFYDAQLVDALAGAIVRAGASVDVICTDMGAERELREDDEFFGFSYNWKGYPDENEIRNWSARRDWVERRAGEGGYDLLIHGTGQPPIDHSYRSDTLPWTSAEAFVRSAAFPRELWDAIERASWELIWKKGRGGRVHITDPEGTDFSYTLFEEYYDPRYYKDTGFQPMFGEKPMFAHLFGSATPPYLPGRLDASGVIAGSTCHFSCPYPTIRAFIENGKLLAVEGGGKYGEVWREMLEATKNIVYPGHPGPGLFYHWETGIGTNPKMLRPANAFMLSGCGTTFERLRSGVVHMGIGSAPRSISERWAAERGLPYGHMHIHLLHCTMTIEARDGSVFTVIENGRLTSLDDPEVVATAKKYGDPKELLREEWDAPMPGITCAGDYLRDYAPDPLGWLRKNTAVR